MKSTDFLQNDGTAPSAKRCSRREFFRKTTTSLIRGGILVGSLAVASKAYAGWCNGYHTCQTNICSSGNDSCDTNECIALNQCTGPYDNCTYGNSCDASNQCDAQDICSGGVDYCNTNVCSGKDTCQDATNTCNVNYCSASADNCTGTPAQDLATH